MSLQVWLPLTKDLRNQGLSNITLNPKTGVTFNSNGKLGGCYTFANSSTGNLTFNTSISPSIITGMTVTAWIYLNGSNTDRVLFSNQSGGPVNFAFEVNNSKLSVYHYNGAWYRHTDTTSLSSGTWYHIAYVCKNSKCTFYINGVAKNTVDCPISSNYSGNIPLDCLGSRWSNGAPFNGNINDFRVYNNALSSQEVKEIAKGLYCHYAFNKEGLSPENLFSWQDKGKESIVLYDYQSKGSFTQFTNCLTFDPATTIGKKYTISFWARSPRGTTPLSVYNANGTPRYFYFSTSLTNNLGTEWEYFTYTFTNQDRGSGNVSYSNRIEIYASNQMKAEVKMIKIEEGEKATPWRKATDNVSITETIEYDLSGFGNNATKTGRFVYPIDTPHGCFATEIDTTASQDQRGRIISPFTYITNNVMSDCTVSVWIKTPSKPSSNSYFYKGLFEFYLNSSGNLAWMYGSSSTGGSGTSASISLNTWNHLVMTYKNGEGLTVYMNGILKWTQAYNVYPRATTDTFFSTNTFPGRVSDFRVYATALSADDVLSLYQNEAALDENGNILGPIR